MSEITGLRGVRCDELRHRQSTLVCFFRGRVDQTESPIELMKQAIDSERGRQLYGGRFATVEPVFGNLRHTKRLNRFTLRWRKKVDGQWKLFCLEREVRPQPD